MKWTNSATDPAGRIQCNKFNKAWNGLTSEHQHHIELSGVIGGEEHSTSYYSPFGGGNREDVTAAANAIGEKYGWTVSRGNVNEIIVSIASALPELQRNRPVEDKRRTPEQDAALVEAGNQQRRKYEQEQSDKQAKIDALVPELRAKYPWAVRPRPGLSEHARTAQNLKTDLQNTFPGIQFRVKSDYNSVSCYWEMGPTSREVKTVSDKYQNAHFDGMTDSTEHDNSAECKAVGVVLGTVRFVSESRTIPDCVFDDVGKMMCELQHVAYNGGQTRNVLGEQDDRYLSDHVHQLMAVTSFPPGAVVIGIESTGQQWEEFRTKMHAKYGDGWAQHDGRETRLEPADLAELVAMEKADAEDTYRHWCKLVLQVPERSATAPTTSTGAASTLAGQSATVRLNAEKGGVEIKFPGKPDESVRDRLKAHGFRWAKFSRVWYKRASESAIRAAGEIAGLNGKTDDLVKEWLGQSSPASEPDRFDMQVEDNMAAQCGL